MNRLRAAKKILLVAPHRLGDSLFATPGIRALRHAKPDAKIDVVALSSLSYELFLNNTCIDQRYQVEYCPIESLAAQYDIVLPLQNIVPIEKYLHGVPHVLALPRYQGAFHYSENFYRFVVENLPEAAQVPLGTYELNFTEKDVAHIDSLLQPISNVSKTFLLTVHMGCHKVAKEGRYFFYKLFPFLAAKNSRSWPFKRFDQLIQRLLKDDLSVHIILTGSASENFAAKALTPHSRILNLMGKTDVNQLAALLKRCHLLLTGDTGPMHVACAVGLPMVLLCGKSDLQCTGPYPKLKHHAIIQKNGMENISVEETYQAILKYTLRA